MNKGLTSLRGYQNGGGVEDDWIDRLVRQLQKRWMNTKGKLYPHLTEMSDWERGELDPEDIFEIDPDAFDFWPTDNPRWGTLRELKGPGGETIPNPIVDELIDLSNFEFLQGDEAPEGAAWSLTRRPGPQAVPPPSEELFKGVRPEDTVDDQLWQRYLGGLDPDELDSVLRNPRDYVDHRYDAQPNLLYGGNSGVQSLDDLIYLSNPTIDIDGEIFLDDREQPHVVPPRSDAPTLSEDLRDMGISDEDIYEEAWDRSLEEAEADALARRINQREEQILNAALHGNISEKQKLEELDLLMRIKNEAKNVEEFDRLDTWLQMQGADTFDPSTAEWEDIWDEAYRRDLAQQDPLLWEEGALDFDRWAGNEDLINEVEWEVEAEKTRRGRALRKLRDWFSRVDPNLLRGIGAPTLLAGAGKVVSPFAEALLDASLTAQEANPPRGSQLRHTYMSQQEMDWEDVLSGGLDPQSYVDIYGTGPDIWDNPLGRSPSSQAAIAEFLRQMRAGTSVNRYRR